MDAKIIRENICALKTKGETSYENCEKLVLLHKALRCLEGDREKYAAKDEEIVPLTRGQAMEWVAEMENADGTRGGHWSMEETEVIRMQRGIDCDSVMFFAAMNMMYSDYCRAAEKTGAASIDFYAYMAKAFLDDKDAAPNKLARYYCYIV